MKKLFCIGLAVGLFFLIFLFKTQLNDIINYNVSAKSYYYGNKGNVVKDIQWKLRNWGYYKGKIDGVYGMLTYKAVKVFQQKNNLNVDGIAGSDTLAALGLSSYSNTNTKTKAPTKVSIPSKNKDLKLIAHLIHGEARGEPYVGKVAVGSVILNRVKDSRFPKTVPSVIYQPGAFDAVADGQINIPPDTSSIKAAKDALNGWDPSAGCVYYFNPSTATNTWIWSKNITRVIGKHNFAK